MDATPEKGVYLTPTRKFRCRFTVQGSRFIGTLVPASTEEAFRKVLSATKEEFSDASHHAYACRIGTGKALIERTSDDHEPSGSAGAPMLQVMQGKNISDAVVIGTRYFGGTKLGIGGLARAYRDCARLPLEKAGYEKKEQEDTYYLELNYDELGPVTRLIETLEGTIINTAYTDSVTLKLKVPARLSKNLLESFISVCRGRGSWRKS